MKTRTITEKQILFQNLGLLDNGDSDVGVSVSIREISVSVSACVSVGVGLGNLGVDSLIGIDSSGNVNGEHGMRVI